MSIIERKVENQVQFWSLLWPFIILLSITILVFKVSAHWYLPIGALIGIPACLKWKMKGLALSLCFLLTILVFSYSTWETDERYWHVGMGMAMAFSLVVLTLSLEEVEGLIGQLQRESQSRLDNLLRLDEKTQLVEKEWEVEKEELKHRLQGLTRDLASTQNEKQSFHKLICLTKDEFINLKTNYELLLEDLKEKKQLISHLKEKSEEAEATIDQFLKTDSQQVIKELSKELLKAQELVHQLQLDATSLENRLSNIQEDNQSLRQEYQNSLNRLQEADEKRRQTENLLNVHLDTLQSKEESLLLFEQEKGSLNQSLAQLNQEIEQQRQLESGQRVELSKQIETVQQIQHRLTQQEKELEAIRDEKKQLEAFTTQQEALLKKQQDERVVQLKERDEMIRLNQLKDLQSQALQSETNQLREFVQTLQEQVKNEQASGVSHTETLHLQEERLSKTQEELRQSKETKERLQEKLEHCQIRLDLQSSVLLENETRFEQLQYSQEKIQQEAEEYQRELFDRTKEMNRKVEEIVEAEFEIKQLKKDLEALKSLNLQLDLFQKEKTEICVLQLERLNRQAKELEVLQEEQNLQSSKMDSSAGGVDAKRMEALYLQLKEQFQEKSNVLNDTRRELFRAQEERLRLEKEWKEIQLFEPNEQELILQKELDQLTKELESNQRENEQEIESLYLLVDSLLKEKQLIDAS